MSKKIFLDTEFTDFIDTKLISIGMAADSGETFYAETPYQASSCSTFVLETVVPLLGKIPNAQCSFDELYQRIIDWLTSIRENAEALEICFDYQTDWDLFINTLNYRVPKWCKGRLVNSEIDEQLICDFRESTNLPEHHALYDAMGNRYAFRDHKSKEIEFQDVHRLS